MSSKQLDSEDPFYIDKVFWTLVAPLEKEFAINAHPSTGKEAK